MKMTPMSRGKVMYCVAHFCLILSGCSAKVGGHSKQMSPESHVDVTVRAAYLEGVPRELQGLAWHIKGTSLVDSQGHVVKLAGLNWSGFETAQGAPAGIDKTDYRAILSAVRRGGFTSLRIPFANQMLHSAKPPTSIGFSNSSGLINQELRGRTSLEVLDAVITYSDQIGLRVILDNHRSDYGSGPQENGLWFTPDATETSWISDWVMLAKRYRNTTAVTAFDLRNEPHALRGEGACWDCGGSRDWHLAAERAGNAVLRANPNMLIVVEGVGDFEGDQYWWGSNLAGVRRSPVVLDISDHVIYSAHEYGPEEFKQPWFTRQTSVKTLLEQWRNHWAFIEEEGIAPLYLGEFGTIDSAVGLRPTAGSQEQWFETLIGFLKGRPEINWSYWQLDSNDRYGIFDAQYGFGGLKADKVSVLQTIQQADGSREPLALAEYPNVHHEQQKYRRDSAKDDCCSPGSGLKPECRNNQPLVSSRSPQHQQPGRYRLSKFLQKTDQLKNNGDQRRAQLDEVRRATTTALQGTRLSR